LENEHLHKTESAADLQIVPLYFPVDEEQTKLGPKTKPPLTPVCI
jgi:hypothetical protein